jgi:transcriptional regulator with XRE-family HTH domain
MAADPPRTIRRRQLKEAANARGRRLVQLMLDRGCDRATLARRSGVAETTIASIENGETLRPHPSTIAKIAHAFPGAAVDPNELYGS